MRCLVVDDDPSDRDLIVRLVGRAGHESVTAHDGTTALLLAHAKGFDVALVDLGLDGLDGVPLLRALRRACPDLPLLVISGFDDRDHVIEAVTAGADGYLLKDELGTHLEQALRDVIEGGGPMSAKVARYVLEALRPAEADSAAHKLSPRETDVLTGLSHGGTYATIARQLGISLNTVRHHVRNLYAKLGVSGKAEAVARAIAVLKKDKP